MSDYRTEVIEAIRAADDALFYLNRAKNSLTRSGTGSRQGQRPPKPP